MDTLERFLQHLPLPARQRAALEVDRILNEDEARDALVASLFAAYAAAARAGYPDSPLLLVAATLAWWDRTGGDIVAELAVQAFERGRAVEPPVATALEAVWRALEALGCERGTT